MKNLADLVDMCPTMAVTDWVARNETTSVVPNYAYYALGMSSFVFSNSSFFIAPLKKNFVSFHFCLKYKNKINVFKYFNIEKDFLKTFNQLFFRFSFFVFVWERFVSSKQNLLNTTDLILSNWLNSMVVRLDISSNFFKNKPLLLFRSNPRRF